MTSIFSTVLGADFDRLHPMMQRRFGVGLATGEACVGRGVMTEIRRGPWWTVPFLQIGRLRNILIPTTGENVPFTIWNSPYRDPLGRETVTFVREYAVCGRPARFPCDHDRARRSHRGLPRHAPAPRGRPRSPRRRRRGGLPALRRATLLRGPRRLPRFPLLLSGRATLRERFDDDDGRFHVDMRVDNDRFGFLFGYRGSFTCEWMPASGAPAHVIPRRHEARV